eukprot:3493908-Pyramimonas_sp.AAC.1
MKDYTRLLGSQPTRRLNPAKLLETNEYFQNKLLDTVGFLENLALKDSSEKVSRPKVSRKGVEKRCREKVSSEGVEKRCRAKVSSEGVERRCRAKVLSEG